MTSVLVIDLFLRCRRLPLSLLAPARRSFSLWRIMWDRNERRFGGYGRRYVHRDGESLMVRCLADGSLDVGLESGMVWSRKPNGLWRELKVREDEDGYLKFTLSRKAPKGSRRKPDKDGRRREHMTVFVHRLVMVKKIAVAANEKRWQTVVRDLPGSTEVHHKDLTPAHNWASNLTLELSEVHHNEIHGECYAVAEF